MRLTLLTLLTMSAFAANSVFARLALETESSALAIDPASYSAIRLISGALMLVILALTMNRMTLKTSAQQGTWFSAFALFTYAVAFSYAYLNLGTGMGALILFSCVQATMISWGLYNGDRPSPLEWLGMFVALGAFVWLVSPGLEAPDPLAAALMALSGLSWGVYSLRGKSVPDPFKATTGNFVLSVPISVVFLILAPSSLHISVFGFAMAVCSGAISSALGYTLWYQVLKNLTATQGAIVQLSVPVIAGIGGLLLLTEPITTRFSLASLLILGGIAVVILGKQKHT